MKGLIIKERWLDLILSGEKTLEVRGSNCRYRGSVALIQSGSGCVMGVATISHVEGPYTTDYLTQNLLDRHCVPPDVMKKWGGYKTNYCWVLDDAYRLPHPIPYKHPPGAVIWVSEKHLPEFSLSSRC